MSAPTGQKTADFISQVEDDYVQAVDVSVDAGAFRFQQSTPRGIQSDGEPGVAADSTVPPGDPLDSKVPPGQAAATTLLTVGVRQEDVSAFQERWEAMAALFDWLQEGRGGLARMLVSGKSGTGKTVLARMFAARAAAKGLYEGVFFLAMSDGYCAAQYAELAQQLAAHRRSREMSAAVKKSLNVEEMTIKELRSFVHCQLRSPEWEGRWLVVLDDLPDPGDERAAWLARDFPFTSGMTLATSQSCKWSEMNGVGHWRTHALERMTENEACALVQRCVGAWRDQEADVRELARGLECFPPAVQMAAAYAKAMAIPTPRQYLEEQKTCLTGLREHWVSLKRRSDEYSSFAAVVALTFARLGKIAAVDGDGQSGVFSVLRKMSLVHPDGILQEMFEENEWHHVLESKDTYSLLDDSPAGGVSMHRMTQKVLRDMMMGDFPSTSLASVFGELEFRLRRFDRNKPSTYLFGGQFARHVLAAAKHHTMAESIYPDGTLRIIANACNNAGDFFNFVVAQHEDALQLHEKCLAIRIATLGDQHPKVATTYNNIANVYLDLRNLNRALELYEKSLAMWTAVYGEQHPDVALVCTSIGIVYHRQGKLDRAREMYKKGLAIRIATLGQFHPDVATSYNYVGEVRRDQGNLGRALELFEKCLTIRIAALGEQHLDVAMSYSKVALMNCYLKRMDRALELHEKCLAIRIAILGELHHDVATSYENIAIVYHTMKRFGRALELYERCLVIQTSTLGEQHPDVATTYNNIAGVYHREGVLVQALGVYEKSLAIRIAALGDQHPNVATSYNNIANVHYDLGNMDRALELYAKSLAIWTTAFGEQHPDVALAYSNIGIVHHKQGKLKQALDLYEKSLAIRIAKLGQKHPDVALSHSYIATVCHQQGKLDRALELFEMYLAFQIATLGEQDLDVATAYNNVACLLLKLGKQKRALELYEKCLAVLIAPLGEQHPNVVTTYNNIATAAHKLGELDRALELYEKCCFIKVETVGEKHPDVATSYNKVAHVCRDRGELRRALELYERCLAIRIVTLGKEHPDVADVRRAILGCKFELYTVYAFLFIVFASLIMWTVILGARYRLQSSGDYAMVISVLVISAVLLVALALLTIRRLYPTPYYLRQTCKACFKMCFGERQSAKRKLRAMHSHQDDAFDAVIVGNTDLVIVPCPEDDNDARGSTFSKGSLTPYQEDRFAPRTVRGSPSLIEDLQVCEAQGSLQVYEA